MASVHLDFWNVQPGSFPVTTAFDPIWRFLNRNSGQRFAHAAAGAWIGFRDGLDAMDLERFPESTFGKLTLHKSRSPDDPAAPGPSPSPRDGDAETQHAASSWLQRGLYSNVSFSDTVIPQ